VKGSNNNNQNITTMKQDIEEKMINFADGICPLCGGAGWMEITDTFDEVDIKTVTLYCSACEKSFEAVYRLQAINPR